MCCIMLLCCNMLHCEMFGAICCARCLADWTALLGCQGACLQRLLGKSLAKLIECADAARMIMLFVVSLHTRKIKSFTWCALAPCLYIVAILTCVQLSQVCNRSLFLYNSHSHRCVNIRSLFLIAHLTGLTGVQSLPVYNSHSPICVCKFLGGVKSLPFWIKMRI